MTGPLRILQLNILRSRARMEALVNDTETRDLNILLIQEPLTHQHLTHVQHGEWTCYQPTSEDETSRPRSLIYQQTALDLSPSPSPVPQPRRDSSTTPNKSANHTPLLGLHTASRESYGQG
jgi:hypothetical protein